MLVVKAGLTMWWAMRTPQPRGPTGKLGAKRAEVQDTEGNNGEEERVTDHSSPH